MACTEPLQLQKRRGCKTARVFIDEWIRSRLRRLYPPSHMGGQVTRLSAAAKLEPQPNHFGTAWMFTVPCKDDSELYAIAHRTDERTGNEAWMDTLMMSLADDDRAVVILKHTPIRYITVTEERRLSEYREGDGRELIRLCDDVEFGVFEAKEAVMHPDELISEILFAGFVDMTGHRYPPMDDSGVPYSETQIRYRLRRAYRRINEHLADKGGATWLDAN